MAFQKFVKDPDAVLDYEWDWSAWLTAVGDTIDTATFIPDDGITVDSSSNTATSVVAWVSGGTAGASHDVVCRITTLGGRTDDRTATFKITEC